MFRPKLHTIFTLKSSYNQLSFIYSDFSYQTGCVVLKVRFKGLLLHVNKITSLNYPYPSTLPLPILSPSLLSTVLTTKSVSKVSCICCPRKWFRCSCSMRSLSSSSSGSQVPSINHWPLMTGIWSCSVRQNKKNIKNSSKRLTFTVGIDISEPVEYVYLNKAIFVLLLVR